jgi:cobalt/nickel transport system permease protein
MLTTRFPRFIQAMESLRFPRVFVTMTSITYRFMFLFVNEAYRMVLAKESRTTKRLRWRENLKLLANMIAILFIRAYERGERVYLAMLSRGYTRRLRTPENMRCIPRDWSFAGVSFLTCLTVLLVDYFRVGGF